MEEAPNDCSLAVGKSQKQEGGYYVSTKRQKESSLCYIDGHLSPQKKKAELETTFQKYKGRVVLLGDIVKDHSGAYAVFTCKQNTSNDMFSRCKSVQ